MSRGRYLSLEEARKTGQLKRFAKEHPIEDRHPDGAARFKRMLESAAKGSPEGRQTSSQDASGDCSGTRTRQDTSEDA